MGIFPIFIGLTTHHMAKALPTLFLLLFISCFAIAQDVTLSGIITDEETKEPLVGASVVTEGGTGVTTDLDGRYTLKLPKGVHNVRFSFIGYKPKLKQVDLTAGANLKLDMALSMKSEQLDIVVVSASQYQKSIAQETVTMEVVNKELIQSTNATDLGQAINKTPGVLIQDSQISIRGGSSWSYGVGTRTAVMQDGMSMMSADLGEAQLNQSPIQNVSQIEVIKGASSVVYGSSALNGVVNVITAWPTSPEPKTEITVFQMIYDNPPAVGDSLNTRVVNSQGNVVDTIIAVPDDTLQWWDEQDIRGASGLNFSHSRKINGTDLILGGSIFYHKSYLEYANELRGNFNFKTRFHSKKKLGLNYGVNGNFGYEHSGRFFLATNPNEGALRSAVPGSDRYFRMNIDPHLHSQNDKGLKHSLETRYMYIMRISGNTVTTPHAISHQLMANYQFQKLWKKWSLTSGVPLNVGISSSNLYVGTRISYSSAIYVQGEFKTKRLSAVAGLRYEVIGVDDFVEAGKPVFRSGINYQAGKATFIRASFGQSYRLPTIAERYLSEDLSGLVQVIPNRQLVAESGMSAELGVKQAVKVSKWIAYVDFAFFYQQYKNLVEYGFVNRVAADSLFVGVPETISIGLYPQNVSNALVAGYEIGLASQGSIGPVGINALVGYTYNYPVNLDSAKNFGAGRYLEEFFTRMGERAAGDDANYLLKLRPRHMVKGDIQLSYKGASIGATVIYGSYPENIPEFERLAVDLLSGEFGATDRYSKAHEKGDFILNLRASYQISKLLKVAFLVNNVTNRIYSFRPSKIEPIRNYTLQLKFTF